MIRQCTYSTVPCVEEHLLNIKTNASSRQASLEPRPFLSPLNASTKTTLTLGSRPRYPGSLRLDNAHRSIMNGYVINVRIDRQ